MEDDNSTMTLKYVKVDTTLCFFKEMALLNQAFCFDMKIIFKINKHLSKKGNTGSTKSNFQNLVFFCPLHL